MNDLDQTRRSHRVDPDQTQPNRPIRPTDPPTPHGYMTPATPYHMDHTKPPDSSSVKKYYRRRRRKKAIGCMFQGLLLALLIPAMLASMIAFTYWIAPPQRLTILVMGLDAREDEGMATRTDSIMLATIDPRQPYVGMLSIPRDLYIDIPGYGTDRINTANALGEMESPGQGKALAKAAVEQNFNIEVDRVVRLNFEGFTAVIDAAGGVMVDVPEPLIDDQYPTADYGIMAVEFEQGLQHMDGERALQYARIRHGSSDFQRIERQQQVLVALIQKLAKPRNWIHIPRVIAALNKYVETDITLYDIIAMAPAILWAGPDAIDHRVIDANLALNITTPSGASVLEPQWDLIDPVVQEIFRR